MQIDHFVELSPELPSILAGVGLSWLELDWRGHNAGTTQQEDLAWFTRYIFMAFEGIFLTTEEPGSYIYGYTHISRSKSYLSINPRAFSMTSSLPSDTP